MSDLWLAELWGAIGDTVLMVGISALVALLAGIPLALVLVATTRGGIYERRALNTALGSFVNAFRSTPFIILMIAIIPLTRLIVGTSIRPGSTSRKLLSARSRRPRRWAPRPGRSSPRC